MCWETFEALLPQDKNSEVGTGSQNPTLPLKSLLLSLSVMLVIYYCHYSGG